MEAIKRMIKANFFAEQFFCGYIEEIQKVENELFVIVGCITKKEFFPENAVEYFVSYYDAKGLHTTY